MTSINGDRDALSKILCRPLRIGKKQVSNRLMLSPMTFLGHVAYRELLDRYGGCGLYFSEMCSAKRIPHENRHTSGYFRWRDEEANRLVVQIMGDQADRMAKASSQIEKMGLFGVDINFGCSAASIRRIDCGAALLKTPAKAANIVKTVRRAVSFPVFVKFRIGWKDDPRIPIDLAKRFEDAGADALTFHPRIAPDRRLRPAKWDYIRLVKNSVSIPVFGNGDVFSAGDCRQILQETGCDGVSLGRIAIARPWIFSKWITGTMPQMDIYRNTAFQHWKLLKQHFEPKPARQRFQRFITYYAANFQFGHSLNSAIAAAGSNDAVQDALLRFFDQCPNVRQLPNLNFLR